MNKQILTALKQVQKELKAPKGQWNDFGKYNYRSAEDILEAVKPILPENYTIFLSDELVCMGNRYYVKATATFQGEEDSIAITAYAREDETKKGMDGSQITGTASSYARKYALNGLFLIDDTKDADSNEHHKQTDSSKATEKNDQKTTPAKSVKKGENSAVNNNLPQLSDTDKADLLDYLSGVGVPFDFKSEPQLDIKLSLVSELMKYNTNFSALLTFCRHTTLNEMTVEELNKALNTKKAGK